MFAHSKNYTFPSFTRPHTHMELSGLDVEYYLVPVPHEVDVQAPNASAEQQFNITTPPLNTNPNEVAFPNDFGQDNTRVSLLEDKFNMGQMMDIRADKKTGKVL